MPGWVLGPGRIDDIGQWEARAWKRRYSGQATDTKARSRGSRRSER